MPPDTVRLIEGMRVTLSPTWNLCESIAEPVFAQRNIVNATTTYAAEQRDELTMAFLSTARCSAASTITRSTIRGSIKNVGGGNWFGHSKTPPWGDHGGVSALGTQRSVSCSIRALSAQLGEQASDCDHESSHPCGQAKKQHKVAQENRHYAPLIPSPVRG